MGKPLVFYMEGLGDFVGVLGSMEQVPQKCVTKAAGKGANVVRKSIRAVAPVDTGALKRGIIREGERSRKKGKKVYKLMFDPGKNDVFQKPIKNPGAAGGNEEEDHAYYPASMEFGFLTRSKGGGMSYVEGRHFMRDGAESSSSAAKQEMVRVLNEEIDKEWAKK